MEKPDIQPDAAETQFFADLQIGKPGVYILDRALNVDEKTLVPPSRTYFIEGKTWVQIYRNVDEALLDPNKEAKRQLHEGMQTITEHTRRNTQTL